MKTLPTEFTFNEFRFQQLKRDGNVALFQKTKSWPWAPDHTYWEVVIVQSHEGFKVAGKYIEPAEHMPSNEQWGDFGWSPFTLADAEARFASLVEKARSTPTVIQ